VTASAELAAGLTQMRSAFYYKETKKRWGPAFPQSLLGQAETKFMTNVPTRPVVEDGLELFRTSWAYQKTRKENPNKFALTAMGKAETAFVRARNLLPSPVVGMGLFSTPGVFCINPRGGVENSDQFAAAGFKWAAANVGYHGTEEWEFWRTRMLQHGVTPIPWRRCYVQQNMIDLIGVANLWNAPACCPNIEAEAVTTMTPYMAAPIMDAHPNLRYGIVTEPWMQNGAGWQVLGQRNAVAICEAFLNADPRWNPEVLREHAKAEGMPLYQPVFGAGVWADAPINVPPSVYFQDWPAGPYSVYPIDGKNAMDWKRP